VSVEIEKYLSLLDRRLCLLRELAQQLVVCRKDFMAMDLEGMHARIAEQEVLCRQIQSLHPAIEVLQRTCALHLDVMQLDDSRNAEDASSAQRLRGVMRDLANAQAEVSRLNRIHAAYLRRSGRTVQMLMNLLANYAFTYARPAGAMLPAPRIVGRG
jgi:hypothetical protein